MASCSSRWHLAGGGAYKYGELFKERLGVVLDQEDEMACLVSGCNFLLRAIQVGGDAMHSNWDEGGTGT